MNRSKIEIIKRQNGSALIVSLVILLIMTLIGVQAIRTTTLEEKMSGNYLDNQIAFEAAEYALKEGGRWLLDQTEAPIADSVGSNRVWEQGVLKPVNDPEDGKIYAWGQENIVSAGNDIKGLSGKSLAAQPQYYIEQRQSITAAGSAETGSNVTSPIYYYNVFARGVGGTASSVVLLQTSFAMQY